MTTFGNLTCRSEDSKKSSCRVLQVRGVFWVLCPASQTEDEKAHYFVDTVDSDMFKICFFNFFRENYPIEIYIVIYSTYRLNICHQLFDVDRSYC